MTALKAGEVARFLKNPEPGNGVFLVFGSDGGLVRETAQTLVGHFAGADPDPMALVSFNGDELDSDPGRLVVEARTPSLFGDARVVRVRGATKKLLDGVKELLDEAPQAAVILEADNLQRRDPLRVAVERSPVARALPCYADNETALVTLIRDAFAAAGITADPDVIPTLRGILGNDREITRREIEKLTTYALESKHLTREDVIALCGDNAALLIDQIVDAAGTGHAEKLDAALGRAFAAGVDAQWLLSTSLQHFSRLRAMRVRIDAGTPARQVVEKVQPPVHFSRKPLFEQQLRTFDDATLGRVCTQLLAATGRARRNSALAPAIMHRALLAVCQHAAHR